MKKNPNTSPTKHINIRHERNNVALPFSYIGPLLHLGAMPAVVYFALSEESSLTLDPFNQPAIHLSNFPMRILSLIHI